MQYQAIDVPFAGGVNQKLDQTLLQPGMFALLQDCTLDKPGTLKKRHGFTSRSSAVLGGGALASALRLATYQGEMLAIDGHVVYSYDSQNATWANKDQVPEALATVSAVQSDATGGTRWPVVMENQGIRVVAWRDLQANLQTIVTDSATGAAIFNGLAVASGAAQQPMLVSVGNFIWLVYSDVGSILGIRLDVTAPSAWGAPVVLTATYQGFGLGGTFDACPFDATKFLLAYWDTGGGGRVSVSFVTAAGALAGTNTVAEIPTNCISVMGTPGELIYVAWHNGANGVRCAGLNAATLANVFGATTLLATVVPITDQITIGRLSATQALVTWREKETATLRCFTRTRGITNAGALVGVQQSTYSVGIVSRPFVADGRMYVLAQNSGTTGTATGQPTHFLLDLGISDLTSATKLFRVVAQLTPATSFARAAGNLSPVAVATSGGAFVIAVSAKSRNAVTYGDLVLQYSFDMAAATRWLPAEFGKSGVLTGGVTTSYDGALVTELGFHLYPELMTATQGAGGALADGVYGIAVVYEWTDAKGQRVQSAPGLISKTVAAGGGTATIALTVPNLNLTAKTDLASAYTRAVKASVYVTSPGGTVYYLNTGGFSIPTSSADMALSIGAIVTTAEQLYTTGGALDNSPVPASRLAVAHQNRLWLAIADDTRVLRYSKELTVGQSIGFNEGLEVRIDDGGDITAVASMDDKLVVFKANAVFYVFGQGATNAGTGDSLNWARIVSETGCTEPRSVVLTPEGLVFLGAKGFYLLDRSLQVSYIGAPVEDTVAAMPVCSFATHSSTARRIYFGMADTAQSSGVVLVYDYYVKAWFHWYPQLNLLGSSASTVYLTGVVWNNVFHFGAVGFFFALPTGPVFYENAATFADNAANYVSMRGRIAPIRLAGVQGWQKVRRATFLTQRISDFIFNVTQFNDYPVGPTPSASVVFPAAASATGTGQLTYAPHPQKCEAMSFEFFDTYAGTLGEGYQISGIELVIGAAKGSFRLQAGARL